MQVGLRLFIAVVLVPCLIINPLGGAVLGTAFSPVKPVSSVSLEQASFQQQALSATALTSGIHRFLIHPLPLRTRLSLLAALVALSVPGAIHAQTSPAAIDHAALHEDAQELPVLHTVKDVVDVAIRPVGNKKPFEVYRIPHSFPTLFIHTASRRDLIRLIGRGAIFAAITDSADPKAPMNDRVIDQGDDFNQDGKLDDEDVMEGLVRGMRREAQSRGERLPLDPEQWKLDGFQCTTAEIASIYNSYQQARARGLTVVFSNAFLTLFQLMEYQGIIQRTTSNTDGSAVSYQVKILANLVMVPDLSNIKRDEVENIIRHEFTHVVATDPHFFSALENVWNTFLNSEQRQKFRNYLANVHNVLDEEPDISQEERNVRHGLLIQEFGARGRDAIRAKEFSYLNVTERIKIQNTIQVLEAQYAPFLSTIPSPSLSESGAQITATQSNTEGAPVSSGDGIRGYVFGLLGLMFALGVGLGLLLPRLWKIYQGWQASRIHTPVLAPVLPLDAKLWAGQTRRPDLLPAPGKVQQQSSRVVHVKFALYPGSKEHSASTLVKEIRLQGEVVEQPATKRTKTWPLENLRCIGRDPEGNYLITGTFKVPKKQSFLEYSLALSVDNREVLVKTPGRANFTVQIVPEKRLFQESEHLADLLDNENGLPTNGLGVKSSLKKIKDRWETLRSHSRIRWAGHLVLEPLSDQPDPSDGNIYRRVWLSVRMADDRYPPEHLTLPHFMGISIWAKGTTGDIKLKNLSSVGQDSDANYIFYGLLPMSTYPGTTLTQLMVSTSFDFEEEPDLKEKTGKLATLTQKEEEELQISIDPAQIENWERLFSAAFPSILLLLGAAASFGILKLLLSQFGVQSPELNLLFLGTLQPLTHPRTDAPPTLQAYRRFAAAA